MRRRRARRPSWRDTLACLPTPQRARRRRSPFAHGATASVVTAQDAVGFAAACSARGCAASAMLAAMRLAPRRLPAAAMPAAVGLAAALRPRGGPRRRLLAERRVQARRAHQRSFELHPAPQHHELRPRPVLPADDDAQRAAQADARRQRHRPLLPAALHPADARQRRPVGPVRRLRLRVDRPLEEGHVHLRGDHPVQPGLQVRRRQRDLRVLRHAHRLRAGLSRGA